MGWRIFHKAETVSTNSDAAGGAPGDVFSADVQTGGRGRLGHKWVSQPGANLLMSAVVDVAGMPPDEAATLPLAAGLAAALAAAGEIAAASAGRGSNGDVRLKWPNDVVLADGRKICGILCERTGDRAVVGIGLNVNQIRFDPVEAPNAASIRLAAADSVSGVPPEIPAGRVMDALLARLDEVLALWRAEGFGGIWRQVAELDYLKGRVVSVRRMDGDPAPAGGLCGGICDDGSLDVGGMRVYAGEAHVESAQERPFAAGTGVL